MAKRDRIDHSIEFWSDKKVDRFLLLEPTIELLGRAIRTLKRRKRFGIEHANALTLAVSLIESQMRDCIRLAIDDNNSEINHESEFVKDIKVDAAFISSMRARRLTLGEFVFLNTGISTVERQRSFLARFAAGEGLASAPTQPELHASEACLLDFIKARMNTKPHLAGLRLFHWPPWSR
jgi:hypothetical protein